ARLPPPGLDDTAVAAPPPAAGRRGVGGHHPAGAAAAGLPLEAAALRAVAARPALAPGQRGVQRGLRGGRRTGARFSDATIVTETPPLRPAGRRSGSRPRCPSPATAPSGCCTGR